MTLDKDFEDFIRLLNLHEVGYMVVGGYALALHGKPRHTGDLDIWIETSPENARKVVIVLKAFGFGSLSLTVDDLLRPGYVTQIGYPPLRIDILNEIDGLTFQQAKKEMQQLTENDLQIKYIGLHDFIRNKTASGRSQDLADIKEIKKISTAPMIIKKNIS